MVLVRRFNMLQSCSMTFTVYQRTAEWPRFGKAKLLSGIPHTAARRGGLSLRAFSSLGGGTCFDNWHLICQLLKYI